MPTYSLLGGKLRELRGNQSLRDFAKKLCISHTYLDSLERGYDFRTGKPTNVSIRVLLKISIQLRLSYQMLSELACEDVLNEWAERLTLKESESNK